MKEFLICLEIITWVRKRSEANGASCRWRLAWEHPLQLQGSYSIILEFCEFLILAYSSSVSSVEGVNRFEGGRRCGKAVGECLNQVFPEQLKM